MYFIIYTLFIKRLSDLKYNLETIESVMTAALKQYKISALRIRSELAQKWHFRYECMVGRVKKSAF